MLCPLIRGGLQVTLHVLYTLAVNPEHVTTLREEIKDVVAEHGWSRLAISEMFKLDSYIKEVSRVTAFLGSASHASHSTFVA